MNDFHTSYASQLNDDYVPVETFSDIEFEDRETAMDSDESVLDRLQKVTVFPELSELESTDNSPVVSSLKAIEWIEALSARSSGQILSQRSQVDYRISLPASSKHSATRMAIWASLILRHTLVGLTSDSQNTSEATIVGAASTKEPISRAGTGFTPSDQLLNYWINGMRSYASVHMQSGPPQGNDESSNVSEIHNLPGDSIEYAEITKDGEMSLTDADLRDLSTLRSAFAIKLKRLVSQIAYRQQNGIEERVPVADGSRFNIRFQLGLLDKFPIVPYDTGGFLDSLHREMSDFFRAGGQISGNWGKLRLSKTGIYIDVAPAPHRSEGYEAATMDE